MTCDVSEVKDGRITVVGPEVDSAPEGTDHALC
ncbi:hypothetical protein ACFL5O_04680 [Myxococcota bacterium]